MDEVRKSGFLGRIFDPNRKSNEFKDMLKEAKPSLKKLDESVIKNINTRFCSTIQNLVNATKKDPKVKVFTPLGSRLWNFFFRSNKIPTCKVEIRPSKNELFTFKVPKFEDLRKLSPLLKEIANKGEAIKSEKSKIAEQNKEIAKQNKEIENLEKASTATAGDVNESPFTEEKIPGLKAKIEECKTTIADGEKQIDKLNKEIREMELPIEE